MTVPTTQLAARECIMMRVRMTSRAVTKHYDDAFRDLGITGAQATLLMSLNNNPGQSATDMASDLVIDRTTLVRNLDLLERNGLIATKADGRSRRKELTPEGERVVQSSLDRWNTAQQSLIERLGASAWSDTRKRLAALRTAAESAQAA